jgi:hypothetical protein
MKAAKSKEGIIAHLTRKHGGNLHEKGIVTITSKSVRGQAYGPKNVLDLTSRSYFDSRNEPGRWICWDFHDMRVRPSHYTIQISESYPEYGFKMWVVEGSLDGESWTEIDRKTNNQDFRHDVTVSFTVSRGLFSKPPKCRFIRLAETGKNHQNDDYLCMQAVEFFGTLSE